MSLGCISYTQKTDINSLGSFRYRSFFWDLDMGMGM